MPVVICFYVTGCGMQSRQNSTASSNTQKQSFVPSKATTAPTSDGTVRLSSDAPGNKSDSLETLSAPQMDMGFYSTDPDKIKKKLKSYPNKYISKENALKQKILLYEDSKQMREIWEDFVAHFRKCQKMHIAYQQALLIVSYTVEGDAIYTYVYNENGSLFVYDDGSRDRYGDGSSYYFQTDKLTLKKYSKNKASYAEYKIGSGKECWSLIWKVVIK